MRTTAMFRSKHLSIIAITECPGMRMSGFLFAFLRSSGWGKKRFYTFYNFYNAIYQHIKP